MKKEIFFQASLPRAGSTLLQNIMGQNPKFYVTPTSGVLELLYSARGQYSNSPEFKAQDSELMKKGFLGFCENGIQGFYGSITDAPYILDKSRGWGIHYDFLSTFIDNPKVICMVRDVRSIFSSMEKNFRKNPELAKNMVNWSTGEGTTIDKRVTKWATSQPVGLALDRLKEIINMGIDKNILFIKYEDLVKNPENEMRKIYTYLNIDNYEHHDFTNVEQITVEDDSVYGIYGDHTIKKEVKFIEPDYNKILTPVICDKITASYDWFYQYFKYD